MPSSPTGSTQPPPDLTPEAYRTLQLDRSLALKTHDPGERTRYLISRMARFLKAEPPPRILCVGSRNRYELDYLAEAGYTNAIGIDLHSTDPRIRVMDMHSLSFGDASFDAVFAAHSLEHALEPTRAASEIERVVTPAGLLVIEVPIRYGRRGADLWDFESPENVAALFPGSTPVWSETGLQIGGNSQQAARVILRRDPAAR